MEIIFLNLPDDLKIGLDILLKDLEISLNDKGTEVTLNKNEDNKIKIIYCKNTNKAQISYSNKTQFYRAVNELIIAIKNNNDIDIEQSAEFERVGAMFDASRNGVLTVESIKYFLRKMALMGMNTFMMYTEDTYEVKDYPYFGYMRGRYTSSEIKECDEYAEKLGIEMIPCIQTLGHLETALRWDYTASFRDTLSVLCIDNEKTYEFIENLVATTSTTYKTKRIHIGMDEAFGIGSGNYLKDHNYTANDVLMSRHLEKVLKILEKYNLEPIMWGDMFFRANSKTCDYLDEDIEFSEETLENCPKNVGLVYWDYGNIEISAYETFIDKFKQLNDKTIFAGGVAMWNGFCVNYHRTINTTNAALTACKNKKIKEVFATLWANDGNETNHYSALMGLMLFAEHSYNENLDMDIFKNRVKDVLKVDYDAFMSLTKMDETQDFDYSGFKRSNPTKYILWQDVLIGMYDKNISHFDYSSHYKEMKEIMEENSKKYPLFSFIFDMQKNLANALIIKSTVGIDLKNYYDNNDKERLLDICNNELKELTIRINELKNSHREQWFKTYKPFGFETLDIRYGGVIARIETARQRIIDYTEGKIEKIEELEQERLYYGGEVKENMPKAIFSNVYSHMPTAGIL